MKRITILIDDKTEKKFEHILKIKSSNKSWQKIPTKKSIIVEALNLLYEKVKKAPIKDNEIGINYKKDKIKKTIGLNRTNYYLLKRKERERRELNDNDSLQLLSSLFENAINNFYLKIKEREKPEGKRIHKRQTIYISERSNQIYNKLAFKYKYTLQELANLIVKICYGNK